MCNIIVLNPGQMPVYDEFENMCYNNWHAFGLVTIVDGKLDIVKENFVDKEIDPKTIWNLLQKDRQFKRILHVRHITAGANSVENTHPFEVYYSNDRHVLFMHNGTLHDFKSKKPSESGHYHVDDPDGPSDSKNFAERIITPALTTMDFGNGKGDIQGEFLHKVLREFWALDNRGILISNNQEPFFLGDWKKQKDADGGEYWTANTTYFNGVIRGPEFTRREARRKEEEAKKSDNKTAKTTSSVANLSKYPGLEADPKKRGTFRPSDKFSELLQDWDVWDRDGMASLAAMTDTEVEEFLSYKQDSVWFFQVVLEDYSKMYDELQERDETIGDLRRVIDAQTQQIEKNQKKVA